MPHSGANRTSNKNYVNNDMQLNNKINLNMHDKSKTKRIRWQVELKVFLSYIHYSVYCKIICLIKVF